MESTYKAPQAASLWPEWLAVGSSRGSFSADSEAHILHHILRAAQGIGAYNTTVEIDGDQRVVCFLDTPGHEAFSAMRARGALVSTDYYWTLFVEPDRYMWFW